MRLPAATYPALLSILCACAGSAPSNDPSFAQPNTLMGSEIDSRIDQIPYQHREELLQNLQWLTQAGEQAIPALLKGMKHENAKVRSSCAWTLAQIGDRRVIQMLKPAVRDESEVVRLEVARTLVTLGDLAHCPVLIEGLDSERKEVRFLCHEALKGSTGRDFGFDHLNEDKTARQNAVLGWRQWWSEYAGDPWFAQGYAQKHGLQATQPATPMGEVKPQTPPETPPETPPQGGVTPESGTEQGEKKPGGG